MFTFSAYPSLIFKMDRRATLTAISILIVVGLLAYQQRDLIRRNPKDFLPYLGMLGLLFVVGFAVNDYKIASTEAYFREQFHLPDDAEVGEMRVNHNGYAPTRAVVEFADSDLREFVGGLNDPSRRTPFLFDFSADPVLHADIAQWQDLAFFVNARPSLSHLLGKQELFNPSSENGIKNGKVLCIFYVAETTDGARSCHERTRGIRIYNYVIGVLDLDRGQMHVRYN